MMSEHTRVPIFQRACKHNTFPIISVFRHVAATKNFSRTFFSAQSTAQSAANNPGKGVLRGCWQRLHCDIMFLASSAAIPQHYLPQRVK